MAVIFNEEGLKDLMPPCVVQQFVNHNAVLFKVNSTHSLLSFMQCSPFQVVTCKINHL